MNIEEVLALRKAFNSVKEKQNEKKLPGLEEKKKKLKKARELCIGNNEILKRAIERLEDNGIKVFMAENKEEAVSIILKEISEERLVVKSKSNVTKEIELAEELEKHGIEVVETDIGDRILQLLKAKPSHPTGPIAHLSAKEIATGLSNHYGIEVESSPGEIVEIIKNDIIEHIDRARIGITGANAITAEEGSILLAHNEGNIFETMRKEKHIVVTGIDKLYPNVEEVMNMIKILTYNATGSVIPSFVEVISGISKTADIEKKFFAGVYNPRDVILILLDNKRSEIISNGFKELLYCIGCGNCLIYCPMYNTLGNYFALDNFLGGKGLVYYSASTNEKNEKLGYCLTCNKCEENCPVDINIPAMIKKLRSENIASEAYYFLKSHLLWCYYNLNILAKRAF
jgi:L-lactate dehydrogenase complex protein LldG